MTSGLTLAGVGLILVCVLLEVASQLNFKAASDRASAAAPVVSRLRQPLLWLGIALWATEVVIWLQALEHAPLAVAYPVMTLTYAATPAAAALVLGERMTREQVIGAALIAAGALVITLSDLEGLRP